MSSYGVTHHDVSAHHADADPIDSILLVSFGGPEGPDDVIPFLQNVTQGRDVPDDRLAGVAQHYLHFGGVSPINAQNRELLAAIKADFDAHGLNLPVYWGNRNWHPFLVDTLKTMITDGCRHTLAFVTSAFSSYSGCRQYRQDLQCALDKACAQTTVNKKVPVIDKIRQFYNHPGFITPMTERVADAIAQLGPTEQRNVPIAFTAHSIPISMATNCRYDQQLNEAGRLIIEGLNSHHPWKVVFQSRSGRPVQPWLEPDINDHLRSLQTSGAKAVVVVPVGFVSDHLEVIWDLDTEAAATANEIGLTMVRAATVGTDTRFVSMIRELIMEHQDAKAPRASLGKHGPVGCLGLNCCPAS